MDKEINPDIIEALVAEFEASGCAEFHVRFEGFELHLSNDARTQTVARQSTPMSAAASPPAAPAAVPVPVPAAPSASAQPQDLEGFEIVKAPYLGSFYRSPKPGSPAYVEVGSKVGADTELCLVEVMKLFTAVRAGIAGTIAHILVADGQMVEAGQPLFAIETGR